MCITYKQATINNCPTPHHPPLPPTPLSSFLFFTHKKYNNNKRILRVAWNQSLGIGYLVPQYVNDLQIESNLYSSTKKFHCKCHSPKPNYMNSVFNTISVNFNMQIKR